MSDPIDDKALDEYLRGGSPVSQRYRELDTEDVPPELDRRVLDQARAATQPLPPRSRKWLRWSAPLALAASAVLVLSIVIESGVQREAPAPAGADIAAQSQLMRAEHDQESSQQERVYLAPVEQPALAAPALVPQAPVAAEDRPAPEAKEPARGVVTEVTVSAQRRRDSLQDSATPVTLDNQFVSEPPESAVTQPLSPQSETSSDAVAGASAAKASPEARPEQSRSATQESAELDEVAVTGSRVWPAPARNVGPRDTIPQSAFERDEPAEQASRAQAYSDPERWLEQIRQLRRDGKAREADLEWERFRTAFPSHPVADTDPARKKQ